jgi:hypothetical protein
MGCFRGDSRAVAWIACARGGRREGLSRKGARPQSATEDRFMLPTSTALSTEVRLPAAGGREPGLGEQGGVLQGVAIGRLARRFWTTYWTT